MRIARLVGLSPDGKSLIVVTESGEELIIEADERLRAAVMGDRPRLGQLEIEMESSLTPRDIQARIRAGETLEDVAGVAGIPKDRVERFAAPVLAGPPDGNRLTYLDRTDPYYVGLKFPKLTTPQWVGEPGVEAVVILAIDDMRGPDKWEAGTASASRPWP